jgi:hypothetical protein
MSRDVVRRRLGRVVAVIICVAIAALAARAADAVAAGFQTGLSDPEFVSPSASERATWLSRAAGAGAQIVRVNMGWSAILFRQPADPANPADPAYFFNDWDTIIRDVTSHGLQPLVTIGVAPGFAEGPGMPPSAAAGSWKPDPKQIEAFAHALATRYSGSFAGLPRVRYFQLWDEPNLAIWLSPSYEGGRLFSPGQYRSMLNAFYEGIKSVHSDNVVITGGTAPYGGAPGGERIRPFTFWRSVFCLRGRPGHLRRAPHCGPAVKFDVLAHHPIDNHGPTRGAKNPLDITTPDVHRLVAAMRTAERLHTAVGRRHHQVWATELWWRTNPPDPRFGVPPATQAKYIEQALYVLWRQGVKVVINLNIRDTAYDPANPFESAPTGLYANDGTPKPSLTAFRFPFVTDRRAGRTVLAWGKAPSSGELVIERLKGSSWTPVKTLNVSAGHVFQTKLRIAGAAQLRARIGSDASLTWSQHR